MTSSPRAHAGLFGTPYRLLHGGDYNPEQWRHQPEILAEDPVLMREAHMNHASVGIFSWAALEPKPGEYDFGWLDQAIDRLHAHGVGVMVATPSAARPRWLAELHPDVMRVRRDGTRVRPAEMRHNHCPTSPALRERLVMIDEALAQRYANHPALLGWHIGNEFGGDEDGARCYCERCIAGFQLWLRRRYADDLDALNRAWWSSFWSHTYQDFNQIRPGDDSVEALGLNYRRYQSALTGLFCAAEIAAVRRHSSAPVTTNMHGMLTHYDHGELARQLDLTSYDSYPEITGDDGDRARLHEQCWVVDAVRAYGGQGRPWLLMESCPTNVQWQPSFRLKRPGVHRTLSLAMVAHGSDGVCYFQWRAGRGGMEKLHGAVLMQDAPHDTRVFREVKALGRELGQLSEVAGSSVPSPAAVVWDVHSEWARSINSGMGTLPMPQQCSRAWHLPLWNAGIGVDVPDANGDLKNYRVIVVPGVFLLRPGFAARLEDAARSGAQVLVDALSGWVDDDMACVAGVRPGPLAEGLGLRCEELDQLRSDERVELTDTDDWLGSGAQARDWIDRIHEMGCEVLVRARGGFHDGWPVLTRKRAGEGAFWYVAAGLDETSRAQLLRRVCELAQVAPPLPAVPEGVVVHERVQPDRTFLFVQNPSTEAARVELVAGEWSDAVTGAPIGAELALASWDTRVLTRPARPARS